MSDSRIYSSIAGIVMAPATWILNDGKIRTAHSHGRNTYSEPKEVYAVYQLITETSTFPILSRTNERFMLLDELGTTEAFPVKRVV